MTSTYTQEDVIGTFVVRVTDSEYHPTLTSLDGTIYHPRPQEHGENGWFFFVNLPAGIYRDQNGNESIIYFPNSQRTIRTTTRS